MSLKGQSGKTALAENPSDGSARVVKESDWKAVPPNSMRGFNLSHFSVPGRAGGPAAATASGEDPKLIELRKALHKSEELRLKALEEARQEMVEMAKAALNEGTEKGRIEGEKIAEARFESQLKALQKQTEKGLQNIHDQKASLFLEFERQTVELFSTALHRVLADQAQWQEDIVLPMLREAVLSLGASTTMTVRIHPEDATLAQDKKSFWLTLEMAGGEVRFIPDDRVPRGACQVEAGSTSAVADPTQIADRMAEALKHVHLERLEAQRNLSAPDPANA